MDSESYWEKRMEELEQHWYDKGRQTIEQELTSLYEDALDGIQDDIAVLYGRFAKDNSLSIGDAMALLQGREYRKWRKSIEEYVKEINETGDKGLERELNTLAMRSRITRLDKLYDEVLMALDALGRKADKAMAAYLTDVYQDGYYHSLFEIGKKRGLEGSVSRISEEDAEKVVRTPWSGENYSKRLWNNTEKLGKTIQQVVSSGVHRGLSVQKLSKMVEERMGVGHRQAVRLVRTEMNFSLNRSILDGIKASGMKYYRFVATLDRRTSAQCRAHDGHVYKVEDYSPGTNAPPLHPHCRSTIVGSLKGDSALKGSRAARDAEGKYIRVPADMNYADWQIVYVDRRISLEAWKKAKETFKHHDLEHGIIEVEHTKLHEKPFAVTKVIARKGGIEWNFYNAQGKQYLQVANNDHGHKKESAYGAKGEHAHWLDLDAVPPITHGEATEIPSFARKALGDAL